MNIIETESRPATNDGNTGALAGGTPGGAGRPPARVACQIVTSAYQKETEKEKSPLPGTKWKQADALIRNIAWLVKIFGPERIGFVTLTVGDFITGGKFRNLRDRREAQRRFHSYMTNGLSKRYQCGVVVTERHKNGGIHFHLAVVTRQDIRGNLDFAACFPAKDHLGKPVRKPDYGTANEAIKREWAYLRRSCKSYGFGWHQLQPMRESGEALGCYLGKYLMKDWEQRPREDKGARCLRYFGHWSNRPRHQGQRRETPPEGHQFSWNTPPARAWREMVKQTVAVLAKRGTTLTEDNIAEIVGPKWAWKAARLFQTVCFRIGDWQDAELRKAIDEHNEAVRRRWQESGCNPVYKYREVAELKLHHLRPAPRQKKRDDEHLST